MPRVAPKQNRTQVQRLAVYAGWAGAALLLASLMYWLYLTSMIQGRNWMVNVGLGLSLAMVVFFLGGMGSAIVAGFRSPEGKRSIRSLILISAVLGAIAVANVIAYRRHWQWDLTGNRRLTLAPVTARVLKGLKQKIEVTAFYSQSPQRRWEAQDARRVQDLLAQYADRSPNVKVKVVDYLREPDKWASAQMTTMPPVVLFTNEAGGREEVKGTGEKDFTGALLKLTRTQKHKILFTVGHGELSPDASDQSGMAEVRTVLTEQQHTLETLDLMGKDRKVPSDCTVLVVAGPQVDFQAEEQKAIKDYLAAGGQALVLLRVSGPSLAWLLQDFGLKADENIVAQIVEIPGTGMAQISKTVRISKFETHDMNRGLRAIYFPLARSLTAVSPAPAGITTTNVLRTVDDAIGKPLKQGQRTVDLRPGTNDPKGPFNLAVVAEKDAPGKKARVVAIGGADWASDMLTMNPEMDNRYLATNAINWLASEDALVDIPPKDEPPSQVTLSPEDRVRTFFINLLMMPAVCFFMAAYVWWKRR
ncbi:MAG: hypothetical protein FJX72_04530 [Armatimonadetes bacterium]|nr:hypothetical protein [Armatimonadota bacterium]